ncbi:hypothetical protein PI124_g17274 [Phytophthora idaei]|nr:hypothetical protein PI125_g1010 [Phytophthora idaei]KAG3139198.1 hypothetical protein PI126_g16558 [Phytophthora idaei]KAG3237746.1 hypothetical protein PI124_g17274 [Phytophthora idaei]
MTLEVQIPEARLQTATPIRAIRASTPGSDTGVVEAAVDGLPAKALLLDSGADAPLKARSVLDALESSGIESSTTDVPARKLMPAGGGEIEIHRIATFNEVVLSTSAGSLMLQHLVCYVEEYFAGFDRG